MNIFITLDYELFFGSNSGTQYESIINPTNKLLEVLDKYSVKASFFIDSGYLIKLDEYRKKYQVLEEAYQKVISQIKELDRCGHDIQLHIHPHWEDTYYDGTKWIMNTTRYRLHEFSNDEIDNIVYRYKKILTDIVGDKIFTFRAGGWCLQPFERIKDALKKHDIWLDSTVFENGKNDSKTHYFNFFNTPKKTLWKFDEDPLVENENGYFIELPITSYRLSPVFFWKLAFRKKFGGEIHKSFGNGISAGASKWDKVRMLTQYTNSVVSIDGYKSSYLEKAYSLFQKKEDNKHFVIIGHPKAMSEFSLERLEQFIINNIEENFTIYSREFNDEK